MRFFLVPILIFLVFNAFVDGYIYCALRSYFRKRIWATLHAIIAVILNLMMIVVVFMPKRTGSDSSFMWVMWMLFGYLTVYIPKILFLIFDAASRFPLLWRGHRWKWMSWGGAALGLVIFLAMWWGALFNRYDIDVKKLTVEVANLPRSMDGLKVAQISDLHVGSFGADTSFVSKLVERVNSLHPDVIVFTGDIVNRHSEELKPFMSALSKLKAPYGVYSVMGNHDYGDYSSWPSDEAKAADVETLHKMQGRMGWKMLNNSTDWLRANGDSIAMIGVENVGDPPFKTYGNLSQAYPGELSDSIPKILLSHNPAHWVEDIKDNPDINIALTLAGHTHAMQIELFGLSPSAWRYETWGGLYDDSLGRHLYVNIGAGTVGFPARIGADPEITLFTLKPITQ